MKRRSTYTKSLFRVLGAAVLTILLGLNAPAEARRYASIVVDADTGEILWQRNSDRRVYPASLTKMMTLYMLFEEMQRGRFTLDTKLATSPRAAGQPASKLGLRRGQTITVRQAIQALSVKSANDVATVVAEAISGTEWEFARAMTQRARLLGMRHTTFRNASGLPHKSQRTTAHDMAILARSLMRDFPQHYKFFSERSFRYRGRTYRTHNRMLGRYKGMDGLKTGYTRSSGYNLAASAMRDGRRLIGIVIGGRTSASRNAEMKRLLDAGFRRSTLMVNRPASTIVAAAPPLPRANPRRAPVQLASATESDTPFAAQVKAAAQANATLTP
ncbi:MAG: D-alanyl-D-alanine carboxypeptidase family protein, partial [Alphaproteobacteria bacterium]|nr:D-alanyl-D-alanine carboxypeptidase family protein [Alphaproteobacteria bacterium]